VCEHDTIRNSLRKKCAQSKNAQARWTDARELAKCLDDRLLIPKNKGARSPFGGFSLKNKRKGALQGVFCKQSAVSARHNCRRSLPFKTCAGKTASKEALRQAAIFRRRTVKCRLRGFGILPVWLC
jgi:hypothetical protein